MLNFASVFRFFLSLVLSLSLQRSSAVFRLSLVARPRCFTSFASFGALLKHRQRGILLPPLYGTHFLSALVCVDVCVYFSLPFLHFYNCNDFFRSIICSRPLTFTRLDIPSRGSLSLSCNVFFFFVFFISSSIPYQTKGFNILNNLFALIYFFCSSVSCRRASHRVSIVIVWRLYATFVS